MDARETTPTGPGEATPTVAVDIGPIRTRAEFDEAMSVLDRVWALPADGRPLSWELYVGLAHAGIPAFVARSPVDGRAVGASLAVCGVRSDGTTVVHSHMTGVLPGLEHRGVGRALKLAQRSWARQRGITVVEWTFDPLVRRNGWFNLRVLRATADEYLIDVYGPLTDGINAGVESDRLLAVWRVLDDDVARPPLPADTPSLLDVGNDGEPAPRDPVPRAVVVTAAVPEDIVAVRQRDPDLARRWRLAVRDSIGAALRSGWTVTDMTDDQRYVLRRSAAVST